MSIASYVSGETKAYYSKDLSPKGVGQENVDGVITYFKDVIKVHARA